MHTRGALPVLTALLLGTGWALLATSCTREAPSNSSPAAKTPAATAASAQDLAEAKAVFAERCQMCHGPRGLGDGPMAAMLTPKPRSFADAKWQATTTDQAIATILVGGGQARGMSAAMPAMPELAQKPSLLRGLVAFVRSCDH